MLASQALDKAQGLSPVTVGLDGKRLQAHGLHSHGHSFLFLALAIICPPAGLAHHKAQLQQEVVDGHGLVIKDRCRPVTPNLM
jgi:hypothetical protein